MVDEPYDVIALGEVLVEFSSLSPFRPGQSAQFGISGDVLNVAANAAAAGARVGLVCVLPDDDLGDTIIDGIRELGIDTQLVRRRAGQQGMYLVHSDPSGQRDFFYARRGSVGSTLGVDDLDEAAITSARAVISGGIAGSLSTATRAAVVRAASLSRFFVYDPNFRTTLTTAEEAGELLRELAPFARVVAPSFPTETSALLGADSPEAAAASLHALGSGIVVVTQGEEGAVLFDNDDVHRVPRLRAPEVVDQTGAGDSFIGSLTARLALGDDLRTAGAYAAAAAALCVGGRGGTGLVPSPAQVAALLSTASPSEIS